MIVVLTAWFPQAPAPFLLALALWAAVCALAATLLHNFASYSAALAGYTAAIIAADELGATGGPNADAVFLLAVYRASEICGPEDADTVYVSESGPPNPATSAKLDGRVYETAAAAAWFLALPCSDKPARGARSNYGLLKKISDRYAVNKAEK